MRVLPFLLVAACAAETAPLATDQAPPPYSPAFSVSDVGTNQVRAEISGLPSGAQVFFLRSDRGPGQGPCHPTVPLCTSILPPFDVHVGQADGSGSYGFTYPPNAVGPATWWQAAVFSPLDDRVSQVALHVVGDSDGDFHIDAIDNCPNTPNPLQVDDDGDGAGALCDCNDLDATIYPGAPDPIDGVDSDCDGTPEFTGTYPIGWEGTFSGTFVDSAGAPFPCTGDIVMQANPATTPYMLGSGLCFGPDGPFSLSVQSDTLAPSFPVRFILDGVVTPGTGTVVNDQMTLIAAPPLSVTVNAEPIQP
jgi:hypothetical protein